VQYMFIFLHRWVGLVIAGFLIISGLTGAIISWDHELDDLLNPHLTHVDSSGAFLPSLELAREIEARDPRVRVTFVPLSPEPGEALAFGVDPRRNPTTGRLYQIDYNQVFIDPVTGEELGRREWGAPWPVTPENFVSFLYKLHFSLHIPEFWGIDRWGLWLLGGIALLWTLDCFVGFYLTLPRVATTSNSSGTSDQHRPSSWWSRWAPAWKIKTSGTIWRLNFDVHRAFGLWTWILLFILAFTGFSLNLHREIFYPLITSFAEVTPTPFDLRTPTNLHKPISPSIGFDAVLTKAIKIAQDRNWAEPVGDVFYNQNFGIFGVRFYEPGDDHGAAGVGPARLYFDTDGQYLGTRQPWKGTAGDIFVQAQFPLHSGRILGLPGRILVSVMGVVTAALSITGVVIWWRKRAALYRHAQELVDRRESIPVRSR
jgi:uncharacterized iron-regulated membrane protein